MTHRLPADYGCVIVSGTARAFEAWGPASDECFLSLSSRQKRTLPVPPAPSTGVPHALRKGLHPTPPLVFKRFMHRQHRTGPAEVADAPKSLTFTCYVANLFEPLRLSCPAPIYISSGEPEMDLALDKDKGRAEPSVKEAQSGEVVFFPFYFALSETEIHPYEPAAGKTPAPSRWVLDFSYPPLNHSTGLHYEETDARHELIATEISVGRRGDTGRYPYMVLSYSFPGLKRVRAIGDHCANCVSLSERDGGGKSVESRLLVLIFAGGRHCIRSTCNVELQLRLSHSRRSSEVEGEERGQPGLEGKTKTRPGGWSTGPVVYALRLESSWRPPGNKSAAAYDRGCQKRSVVENHFIDTFLFALLLTVRLCEQRHLKEFGLPGLIPREGGREGGKTGIFNVSVCLFHFVHLCLTSRWWFDTYPSMLDIPPVATPLAQLSAGKLRGVSVSERIDKFIQRCDKSTSYPLHQMETLVHSASL
ncbi:hypothetical protein L249_6362 [Ophiocordyceps polyrhachis-furcata BCC 54312]|uniref:Uncharacterized protein n=1 Tax=Ophiocordyceps polyrhachis-furcata BCC 54312 TaxID=1330021 RepID=A0A367L1B5_9HYPO|nr:hypothetical protein L249_6362 [Ophiocordyceps polyrhachis-furcata BCC 54312]